MKFTIAATPEIASFIYRQIELEMSKSGLKPGIGLWRTDGSKVLIQQFFNPH
jgi:hypothetical protein